MSWRAVTSEPCGLGESPFWHPAEQRLYWLDIAARELLRLDPATGAVERQSLPQEPGCIAPARGGGLVVALRDGLYRQHAWGGALQRLAPAPGDTTRLRFNDGKCDPAGRFWVGTYAERKTEPEAALYCYDPAAPPGFAQPRHAGFFSSNGLAWSPDGATLYWADTADHAVHAWDFAGATGQLARHRLLHRFSPRPPGWSADDPAAPPYGGRPDGATVDAEGCYWVAMFEGGRVLRLSPRGEVLQDLPVPVRCPTMPCLGGEDLKTLFLTTARHGRPAGEIAREPLAGCVLAMRVAVPGLPVHFAGV
jgi:sugar lactone lactonase YvrE